MKNEIPFVKQTALDYDIDYDIVKKYYDKYGSTNMFYEKLEEEILIRSQQNTQPKF